MSNTKVISILAAKESREASRRENARLLQGSDEEHAYQARILSMTKVELLEEMVRFQEERTRVGHLTITMIVNGRHLFKALEATAESRELQILSRSYRRHLESELSQHLRK